MSRRQRNRDWRLRINTALTIVALTAAVIFYLESKADAATTRSANSTCYALRGQMADGSYTRARSVAMNNLPLGSRIKLIGRYNFFGTKRFYVRDRIGWGSQLDFWHPSNARCTQWGRRNVRYIVERWGR